MGNDVKKRGPFLRHNPYKCRSHVEVLFFGGGGEVRPLSWRACRDSQHRTTVLPHAGEMPKVKEGYVSRRSLRRVLCVTALQ